MAWADDGVLILRELVADPEGTTPIYTDDRLSRVLVIAAMQVTQEVTFSRDYSISISNVTITPDPTDPNTADESFMNLICLKSAAILDRGAAILASRRAIMARDGSASVDLRGQAQSWLKLLEKGWNAVYEDARLAYILGTSLVAGAAVMGPFRTSVSLSNGMNNFMFGPENNSGLDRNPNNRYRYD